MRKFILVAAMVLASANAYAGQSRSLILAANDEQPVAAPQTNPAPAPAPAAVPTTTAPQTSATTTTDAPKYVERPAAVAPATTAPAATPTTPAATTETPKTTKTTDAKGNDKADKAKKRRDTEARVIYELHRHGIYW